MGPFFLLNFQTFLTLHFELWSLSGTPGARSVAGLKLRGQSWRQVSPPQGSPRACRQPLPPRTSKAKKGKPRNQTSLPIPGKCVPHQGRPQTKFIKKPSEGHSKSPAGLCEVTVHSPVDSHSSLIGAFQTLRHRCVQEGK